VVVVFLFLVVVSAPGFLAPAGAPPGGRDFAAERTGSGVNFDPAVCRDLPSPEHRVCDYGNVFNRYGQEHDVDPRLLAAVAYAESGFADDVIACRRASADGALGLMQFIPSTAQERGVDPCDTADAISGAAKYLRELYDEFGTWELAAAGYNAGPQKVRDHGGVPPNPETQKYVPDVMAKWDEYKRLFGRGGYGGGTLGSTERYTESRITARMQALLDDVVPQFGRGKGIGCWRPGNDGEHPKGRACDFLMADPLNTMPTDEFLEHGWRLACYLAENAERLDVYYVIWQEKIWGNWRAGEPGRRCTDFRSGQGWEPYRRYPGCAPPAECLRLNHYDHIHVSVE
jgi:Transglycosylase SLT domain